MYPKWSILALIFGIFRGAVAWTARLAEQSAEPLFLLAGAVLSRGRKLCGQTEKQQNTTKDRSDDETRTSSVEKH